MDPMNHRRLKIFVAEGPFNIGRMVSEVLLDLGMDAWTESQGTFSKADVIIMPTSPEAGLGLTTDWQVPLKSGVVIVLWLVDPFPPPDLSATEEAIANRIAELNWRFMLPKRWANIAIKWAPFGREIMRMRRWVCIKKLRKEITRSGKLDYLDCTNREWTRIMVRNHKLSQCMQRGHINYLFATTKAKQQFLAQRGYDIDFIPFGYHRIFGEDLGLERDIDVLFLGRLNTKRRVSLLRNLRGELQAKGVKLRIVKGECYGDERTELLNRTKISLDIPRVPWDFGPERFLMSISCGALVVSEGIKPREPYTHGENFIQAQVSDLADTIHRYLRDEQQRQRITTNAYEYITTQLNLRKSVSRMLEKCNLNAL